MQVLVIGGSGTVGTLVLPYLAKRMQLCIFDTKPSALPLPCIEGNVLDFDRLLAACPGRDALLYLAMGPHEHWGEPANVLAHFDANITGLYLALMAANRSGIAHAAVTGTMSVYAASGERMIEHEDVPTDACDHYGLSKRLGEDVCRAAARQWGMSINLLRLYQPQARADWESVLSHPLATEAGDVARAIELALRKRFGGYEAFNITGDWTQQSVSLAKAKSLLGWEPQARRGSESVESPALAFAR
jgi:nucleoside-diphosphate-sugar epimerase